MRNPNGYGCAYRLPGNRRRPWVARITIGWEWVNCKQRQKYQIIGYFEERTDAMTALALHHRTPVSPKANMTLKELYEEWSGGAFEYIGRDTQNNYRAAWKRLAKFKDVKVKEVRTAHFQKIVDSCRKEGMSRSTLEKIRITAVLMFKYALENDIVNKNYAEFIRLPKVEKIEKERFSDLEIKKLSDNAAEQWTSTVLILIYTGMRISEMLNLTRFNVDLKAGIIIGGIKTDAGKDRLIPIHPKIFKHVVQWYAKEGQALICDEKGRLLSAKRYREKFYYPALEAAEVRKLTPHACRHTFGSLMAEAGADTVSIQKLIGHADYAFTANKYTHPEIEALRKAINKI